MSLLAIRGVMKHFGGVMAVDTVSFDIAAGELVGLIGPNGSGKTTLLNMLSGHLKPNAGEVLLDGEPCQGLKPEILAHRGVTRMFQLTRVFSRLSVVDNLLVVGRALGLGAKQAQERVETLLEELRITHVRHLDA